MGIPKFSYFFIFVLNYRLPIRYTWPQFVRMRTVHQSYVSLPSSAFPTTVTQRKAISYDFSITERLSVRYFSKRSKRFSFFGYFGVQNTPSNRFIWEMFSSLFLSHSSFLPKQFKTNWFKNSKIRYDCFLLH